MDFRKNIFMDNGHNEIHKEQVYILHRLALEMGLCIF